MEHDQSHVLKFWDELNEAKQQQFIAQLESIDFELFKSLQQLPTDSSLGELRPSEVLPLDSSYREVGVTRIERGELCVLTVAGGQGTRLGWSGPKGTFPATPITGKSLFQLVAEQILFASKKYGVSIPWYIMTSAENDAVTRSFLLDNNCFGLERTDIFIFTQGEVPAVNEEGKMLLASQGSIAMNPDGHGGVVAALKLSGGLEEMDSRGIKYISYVQIDNPLANVVDPALLGMHLCEASSEEVTSKCVRKTNPEERVGVFCLVDGKTTIVEYSDLPQEKSSEENEVNELSYGAGSIAIHMMSTEFLQRVADDMPWHRAYKIVPYVDLQTGEVVIPTAPNAFKYERFVFDVLPLSKNSLVVETTRAEEFAPIKNKEGFDSPQSSRELQRKRAICWLKSCSVALSENAIVEVSPLTASNQDELSSCELPSSINDDDPTVV